jgi:hypothetical protein|nr:MAG TPA: hypothetical protein [Caudoviricetes sp.]
MFVVADPELWEIREMLDWVAKAHNLADILPKETPDCSYAECLKRGWCYLWYDEKTLVPLGYSAFSFYGAGRSHYFLFGTTHFVRPHHIVAARRAMLNVMRNALKNRCRVYISDERIAKLAAKSGFRQLVKDEHIWIKEKI